MAIFCDITVFRNVTFSFIIFLKKYSITVIKKKVTIFFFFFSHNSK